MVMKTKYSQKQSILKAEVLYSLQEKQIYSTYTKTLLLIRSIYNLEKNIRFTKYYMNSSHQF